MRKSGARVVLFNKIRNEHYRNVHNCQKGREDRWARHGIVNVRNIEHDGNYQQPIVGKTVAPAECNVAEIGVRHDFRKHKEKPYSTFSGIVYTKAAYEVHKHASDIEKGEKLNIKNKEDNRKKRMQYKTASVQKPIQ